MSSSYYADLDSDAHRLPPGMTRVGYDADTQVYTYTDSRGSLYEGPPGSRYGVLRPVGTTGDHYRHPQQEEEESGQDGRLLYGHDAGGEEPTNRSYGSEARNADWRYLAPFLLIIGVALLLVLKWVLFADVAEQEEVNCREGYEGYVVREGDTCWDIATRFGLEVGQLRPPLPGVGWDEGLDCDRLRIGQGVCVLVKTGS